MDRRKEDGGGSYNGLDGAGLYDRRTGQDRRKCDMLAEARASLGPHQVGDNLYRDVEGAIAIRIILNRLERRK